MDLGAVLLLLALLLGVGFFLAAPLLRGAKPPALDESPEISALLAERDRVITALQDLDFDFKLGKVPEEAYPDQRATLLQQGTAVLRKLDELMPAASRSSRSTANASERIEAAALREADRGGNLADDQIESMLAARRAARHAASAGFCPRCGRSVLTTDRFCPNCGKSLQ